MENSSDGSETIVNERFEHAVDLMLPPRKWQSLVRRADGVNVIDLATVTSYRDLPAHRLCLLLMLLMTMRDQGDELRFEPWRSDNVEGVDGDSEVGFRVLYQVDGQLQELAPPPNYLRLFFAREIETIADLNTPRRRIANLLRRIADKIDDREWFVRRGFFRLFHVDLTIDVDVLAYASILGNRYFLKFLSVPNLVSRRAEEELRRIIPAVPKAS